MNNDVKILRALAQDYFEASQAERNARSRQLHTAVNDLKMIRPVVLIDEIPWSEMNFDGSLTLKCEDPFFRSVEDNIRKTLYKFKHCPADMIVQPFLSVEKIIEHSSMGVDVKEEILATEDDKNNIVAHEYVDQFEDDDSVKLIKDVVVTYKKEETMARYQKLAEAVGDIIPVRLSGIPYFGVVTWDLISRLRGVTPLLVDLVDRPEFCHELVERLTQLKESALAQYEELSLFDNDPLHLHCTSTLCSDIEKAKNGENLTRNNVWGRGAAQIFASVGKGMHDEYDIEYMKRTVGACSKVYYGCCEPLDKKIDIVEKIPNLRKISITPWADVNVAAEIIGKKYAIASKPNPASVAVSSLEHDVLRKELKTILDACKANSCSFELTLKDISTCGKRPENIFEWEKIAMEMVNSY